MPETPPSVPASDQRHAGDATASGSVSPKKPPATRPTGPAVTKRLKVVLYIVLLLFGLLTANGLYLLGVTIVERRTGEVYQNYPYLIMFLGHLILGVVLIVPTVGFGIAHMLRSRHRRNRRAVKIGYALFAASLVILISGILLTRIGDLGLSTGAFRTLVYAAHLAAPVAAIWLYVIHRLVGSRIKWRIGRRVAVAIAAGVALMVTLQTADPVRSTGNRPKDDQYFEPSLAKTRTGKFIDEELLMNDEYCLGCHADIYDSAIHASHKLSSFNNPAYRASVRETRQVAAQRHGTLQASRWCAGCHDPVVLFSGKFDDPNYDDVDDPTAHAGITCIACHAIQSIDSTVGNADYTIDEPRHYPWFDSDVPALQSLNSLMIHAKPAFHKREMLKPFHKSAEFCGTCHKVSLPKAVNDYRWLRGQNHYDSYLLSGVSGHGARSFYYPPKAIENCNGCHMNAIPSQGSSATYDPDIGGDAVAGHAFASANTALAHWVGDDDAIERHRAFLSGALRLDLFGIRHGDQRSVELSNPLVAPLGKRAEVVAGSNVIVETVLRTIRLGHHFTQGTSDSNQVWVEWTATQNGDLIAHSGHRDDRGVVQSDSHFVNSFVLDRHGNRINRRNAQDIFTPLYSHQIPPGAGQTIHYRLAVPERTDPITVTAKLLYRKFDTEYLDYVRADRDPQRDPLDLGNVGDANDLPVIEICSDVLILDVVDRLPEAPSVDDGTVDSSGGEAFPTWQRWNDYGIGLLLSGRKQLRYAAEAFAKVESLGRYDGPLNLARVQFIEGDLNAATESLERSMAMDPPPPSWTHAWLSGVVDRGQGNLQRSADSLRACLETTVPSRGFDFSKDYVVRGELGLTLVDLAQRADIRGRDEDARRYWSMAEDEFQRVLESDSENALACGNLAAIYEALGDAETSQRFRRLHAKYKMDDSAAETAVPAARKRYPAANRAAEQSVIYDTSPATP